MIYIISGFLVVVFLVGIATSGTKSNAGIYGIDEDERR